MKETGSIHFDARRRVAGLTISRLVHLSSFPEYNLVLRTISERRVEWSRICTGTFRTLSPDTMSIIELSQGLGLGGPSSIPSRVLSPHGSNHKTTQRP